MCDNHEVNLLAEKDADKRAVEDLSKQLKGQSGEVAQLTKSKIKELKTLIKAEKQMKSVLAKSRTRFLKTLDDAVKATDPLDGLLLLVIVKVSPSGSVSLLNAQIVVGIFASVAPVSLLGVGLLFTGASGSRPQIKLK